MATFRPSLQGASGEQTPSSHLAIRVFRPPQPVRVVCWGNQPQTLFWQGSRFAIASFAGPWHESGSWWNENSWDHDLWDVVTAEAFQVLRLRQDHASRAWFVVGLYD